MPRVVVCAALKNKEGLIVCGARHYDAVMHAQIINSYYVWDKDAAEQGFIDQYGVFMSREEACKVAWYEGQIVRRCDGDEGKLFSENLY
jgi:hypothetical protein